LPPHYVDQDTLIAAFRERWAEQHYNLERLENLHRAVQVSGRYLALPITEYPRLDSFAKRNDAWRRAAIELGELAIRKALRDANLSVEDVGHLFFGTVTGVSTPSIDAQLVNRLALQPNVKRTPMFGLGCVGGAASLARAADYLLAFPDQCAVVLAVELCSLTLQREDLSVGNMIASGLFGDGAAAAVLLGGGRKPQPSSGGRQTLAGADHQRSAAAPKVLGTQSVFYPNTERVMGWDIVDSGFKVVLSSKVPEIVREHIRRDVDSFLAIHGLQRSQISHWIAHTGGPKVLQAFEASLELPGGALERSWRSLSETGNLSSASVLFVLGDLLEAKAARPGELGLLLAMGPGFCAELVLLQW
jgi:alkylresorcinol/alkylpyrone synthase